MLVGNKHIVRLLLFPGNGAITDVAAHLCAFKVYLIGGFVSSFLSLRDVFSETYDAKHAPARDDALALVVGLGAGVKDDVRIVVCRQLRDDRTLFRGLGVAASGNHYA